MPKASFLAIVFAIPMLALFIPADWFQEIWVPIYIPFGVVIALTAYFRPRSELFVWIFLAPILFWLLVVIVTPFFISSASLSGWGQTLFLVTVVATPIGLMIGAFSVVAAILLYALYRARGWLE